MTAKKRSHDLDTDERNDLRSTQFAFPDERMEPLTDAGHVRNAIARARFKQVEDVSDAERDRSWKKIIAAVKRFDVDADDWRKRKGKTPAG